MVTYARQFRNHPGYRPGLVIRMLSCRSAKGGGHRWLPCFMPFSVRVSLALKDGFRGAVGLQPVPGLK